MSDNYSIFDNYLNFLKKKKMITNKEYKDLKSKIASKPEETIRTQVVPEVTEEDQADLIVGIDDIQLNDTSEDDLLSQLKNDSVSCKTGKKK